MRGAAHGLAPLAGQAGDRPAGEVLIVRLGLRHRLTRLEPFQVEPAPLLFRHARWATATLSQQQLLACASSAESFWAVLAAADGGVFGYSVAGCFHGLAMPSGQR